MVDLAVNAGIGFASGVAGNLFRIDSTGAMREAGEALVEKGMRKVLNGVANCATSTIKRGHQYLDEGITAIYQYACRAGTNSGFGSAVGCIMGGIYSMLS